MWNRLGERKESEPDIRINESRQIEFMRDVDLSESEEIAPKSTKTQHISHVATRLDQSIPLASYVEELPSKTVLEENQQLKTVSKKNATDKKPPIKDKKQIRSERYISKRGFKRQLPDSYRDRFSSDEDQELRSAMAEPGGHSDKTKRVSFSEQHVYEVASPSASSYDSQSDVETHQMFFTSEESRVSQPQENVTSTVAVERQFDVELESDEEPIHSRGLYSLKKELHTSQKFSPVSVTVKPGKQRVLTDEIEKAPVKEFSKTVKIELKRQTPSPTVERMIEEVAPDDSPLKLVSDLHKTVDEHREMQSFSIIAQPKQHDDVRTSKETQPTFEVDVLASSNVEKIPHVTSTKVQTEKQEFGAGSRRTEISFEPKDSPRTQRLKQTVMTQTIADEVSSKEVLTQTDDLKPHSGFQTSRGFQATQNRNRQFLPAVEAPDQVDATVEPILVNVTKRGDVYTNKNEQQFPLTDMSTQTSFGQDNRTKPTQTAKPKSQSTQSQSTSTQTPVSQKQTVVISTQTDLYKKEPQIEREDRTTFGTQTDAEISQRIAKVIRPTVIEETIKRDWKPSVKNFEETLVFEPEGTQNQLVSEEKLTPISKAQIEDKELTETLNKLSKEKNKSNENFLTKPEVQTIKERQSTAQTTVKKDTFEATTNIEDDSKNQTKSKLEILKLSQSFASTQTDFKPNVAAKSSQIEESMQQQTVANTKATFTQTTDFENEKNIVISTQTDAIMDAKHSPKKRFAKVDSQQILTVSKTPVQEETMEQVYNPKTSFPEEKTLFQKQPRNDEKTEVDSKTVELPDVLVASQSSKKEKRKNETKSEKDTYDVPFIRHFDAALGEKEEAVAAVKSTSADEILEISEDLSSSKELLSVTKQKENAREKKSDLYENVQHTAEKKTVKRKWNPILRKFEEIVIEEKTESPKQVKKFSTSDDAKPSVKKTKQEKTLPDIKKSEKNVKRTWNPKTRKFNEIVLEPTVPDFDKSNQTSATSDKPEEFEPSLLGNSELQEELLEDKMPLKAKTAKKAKVVIVTDASRDGVFQPIGQDNQEPKAINENEGIKTLVQEKANITAKTIPKKKSHTTRKIETQSFITIETTEKPHVFKDTLSVESTTQRQQQHSLELITDERSSNRPVSPVVHALEAKISRDLETNEAQSTEQVKEPAVELEMKQISQKFKSDSLESDVKHSLQIVDMEKQFERPVSPTVYAAVEPTPVVEQSKTIVKKMKPVVGEDDFAQESSKLTEYFQVDKKSKQDAQHMTNVKGEMKQYERAVSPIIHATTEQLPTIEQSDSTMIKIKPMKKDIELEKEYQKPSQFLKVDKNQQQFSKTTFKVFDKKKSPEFDQIESMVKAVEIVEQDDEFEKDSQELSNFFIVDSLKSQSHLPHSLKVDDKSMTFERPASPIIHATIEKAPIIENTIKVITKIQPQKPVAELDIEKETTSSHYFATDVTAHKPSEQHLLPIFEENQEFRRPSSPVIHATVIEIPSVEKVETRVLNEPSKQIYTNKDKIQSLKPEESLPGLSKTLNLKSVETPAVRELNVLDIENFPVDQDEDAIEHELAKHLKPEMPQTLKILDEEIRYERPASPIIHATKEDIAKVEKSIKIDTSAAKKKEKVVNIPLKDTLDDQDSTLLDKELLQKVILDKPMSPIESRVGDVDASQKLEETPRFETSDVKLLLKAEKNLKLEQKESAAVSQKSKAPEQNASTLQTTSVLKSQTTTKLKKTKRVWNPKTRKFEEVIVESTKVSQDLKPVVIEKKAATKSDNAVSAPADSLTFTEKDLIKKSTLSTTNQSKVAMESLISSEMSGIPGEKDSQKEAASKIREITSNIAVKEPNTMVSASKDKIVTQSKKTKQVWNPKTRKFDDEVIFELTEDSRDSKSLSKEIVEPMFESTKAVPGTKQSKETDVFNQKSAVSTKAESKETVIESTRFSDAPDVHQDVPQKVEKDNFTFTFEKSFQTDSDSERMPITEARKIKQIWNPKTRAFDEVVIASTNLASDSKPVSIEKMAVPESKIVNVVPGNETTTADDNLIEVPAIPTKHKHDKPVIKSNNILQESEIPAQKPATQQTAVNKTENVQSTVTVTKTPSKTLSVPEKHTIKKIKKTKQVWNPKTRNFDEVVTETVAEELESVSKKQEAKKRDMSNVEDSISDATILADVVKSLPEDEGLIKMPAIVSKDEDEKSTNDSTIVSEEYEIPAQKIASEQAMAKKTEGVRSSAKITEMSKKITPAEQSQIITEVKKTKKVWNPKTREFDEIFVESSKVFENTKPVFDKRKERKSNISERTPTKVDKNWLEEVEDVKQMSKTEFKTEKDAELSFTKLETKRRENDFEKVSDQIEKLSELPFISESKTVTEVKKTKQTWNPKTRKFDELVIEHATVFDDSSPVSKIEKDITEIVSAAPTEGTQKIEVVVTEDVEQLQSEQSTEAQKFADVSSPNIPERSVTSPIIKHDESKFDFKSQEDGASVSTPEVSQMRTTKDRTGIYIETLNDFREEPVSFSERTEKYDEIHTPLIEEVTSFDFVSKEDVAQKPENTTTATKMIQKSTETKKNLKKTRQRVWNPKTRQFEESVIEDVEEKHEKKFDHVPMEVSKSPRTAADTKKDQIVPEKLSLNNDNVEDARNPQTKVFEESAEACKPGGRIKQQLLDFPEKFLKEQFEKPPQPASKFSIEEETFLEFSSPSDTKYRVSKETTHFIVKRDSFKDDIEPPVFLKSIRSAETSVGEAAVFSCQVEGKPSPDLKWFVQNLLIEPPCDGYTLIDDDDTKSYSLVIETPTLDSNGKMVRCVISNMAGSAESTATLTVLPGK